MASIATEPNGRRRILFADANGVRRTLRLGKVSLKEAESVKGKVEAIVSAMITGGTVDDEVSRWIASRPDTMIERLAAVGLAKSRNRADGTLKAFLDSYFAGLTVKPATATAYGHTRRCLLDYFGESKPLRDIEPADADKWRTWLKTANVRDNDRDAISEVTISRRVGVARQFFKRAVKWKLIGENPFADVKAGTQVNKARMFFVDADTARKVLDACPDAQWRLLFALSRYGGLRCPSEHLSLKWSDIDWEHNRIRVPSPKTEHHEGGDCRMIPMFPELKVYLLEVFDAAEPGTEYVITKYRSRNCNLRTQLQRIIRRAGLKPWPKLFHNLRSSRQTELASTYPIHVVCAWLGNSRAVAQEHYLQVTDAHFDAAVKAAQNPALCDAVRQSIDIESGGADKQNRPELPGDPVSYIAIRELAVGDTGLEPVTSRV